VTGRDIPDFGIMCRCGPDCCCAEGQGHRHPDYAQWEAEQREQDESEETAGE
jgi:hypothetical protein